MLAITTSTHGVLHGTRVVVGVSVLGVGVIVFVGVLGVTDGVRLGVSVRVGVGLTLCPVKLTV